MAKTKKPATMGPIRQYLESFGVAILAAVLLKWFCIEAYQIPTSSMQPTLMGSNEAGVYDRILVDKLVQTVREPQRWDITVFKYPLQKNQKYVKRIVGMPGDRLHIGGGNVYQVTGDGEQRTFAPIRKPDDLQDGMWKNVFPTRMLARGESQALGPVFGASPSARASERDGGFVLDPQGGAVRLFFRDEPDGGLIDRVWDGYPPEVARAIRTKTMAFDRPQEVVVDARLSATVTATQVPDELAFELEVLRPNAENFTYALVVRAGQGVLQVRGRDRKVLGESAQFPLPLAAGDATELSFAHVDDQLIAWRDGEELQRFDAAAWAIRDGLEIPANATPQQRESRRAIPQFAVRGKGEVRLDDVRIDRDQHYTRDIAPEVIEVPLGHYYMMGDNTLQSIDSRGWTAITVGVDAEDRLVPPDDPTAVRTIRGNKRAMDLANPPDRDETPIPIPNERAVVMIDEFGEILRLEGEVGPDWGRGPVSFQRPGTDDGHGEWLAVETTNTEGVSFVPRSDIEGRAIMVFYPSRPLSWLLQNPWPDRFGFVR